MSLILEAVIPKILTVVLGGDDRVPVRLYVAVRARLQYPEATLSYLQVSCSSKSVGFFIFDFHIAHSIGLRGSRS